MWIDPRHNNITNRQRSRKALAFLLAWAEGTRIVRGEDIIPVVLLAFRTPDDLREHLVGDARRRYDELLERLSVEQLDLFD